MDKIINTLREIKSKRIHWVHFGDGELMEWLEKESKVLPCNCSVELKGNVPNADILNEYKNNHYDLFINLSDSEGIPVSIMEAMSFGIPCVATNVGGVSELVVDEYNGLLVSSDDEPSFIAKRITENIHKMNEFRTNARKTWANLFNAKINYELFVTELLELVE